MDGHLLALAQVVHVAVALVAELFETEPSVHQDTLPEEGQRRNIQGVLSKHSPRECLKKETTQQHNLIPHHVSLVFVLLFSPME